ncbi:MAG: hypothetical protein MK202_15410 [Tenacibaculum sp.]|nr:hypothetical protein [Tenacibaculum sp.]
MKRIAYYFMFFMTLNLLVGCEVGWETKFNKDGSGKYSMIVDLSSLLQMASTLPKSEDDKPSALKDTVINFSDILETKKDSISKLPKKEQKRLKELEDLAIVIKADTATNKGFMRIDYDFDDMQDLQTLGKKLKSAEIDKLADFGSAKKMNPKGEKKDFPVITDMFDINFSKNSFTTKIKEDAGKNMKSDDGKDEAFAKMIVFKIRYLFPYKIKSVNNENVKILANFKGIEFEANIADMAKNPNFFDVKVDFE